MACSSSTRSAPSSDGGTPGTIWRHNCGHPHQPPDWSVGNEDDTTGQARADDLHTVIERGQTLHDTALLTGARAWYITRPATAGGNDDPAAPQTRHRVRACISWRLTVHPRTTHQDIPRSPTGGCSRAKSTRRGHRLCCYEWSSPRPPPSRGCSARSIKVRALAGVVLVQTPAAVGGGSSVAVVACATGSWSDRCGLACPGMLIIGRTLRVDAADRAA